MNLFVEIMLFVKEWWPLVTFFIGVMYAGYKGVKTINDTLVDIKHELKVSNEKIQESRDQVIKIWSELEKHDERLDDLATKSVEHNERINSLFKSKERG